MVNKNLLKTMVSVQDVADAIGLQTQFKSGKLWLECPNHPKMLGKYDKHLTNCIISTDGQSYHCFGCQSGGDIFTMIMNYLDLSFTEALNWVMQIFGIDKEDIKLDEKSANIVAEKTSLRPFFELLGLSANGPAEVIEQEYFSEEEIPESLGMGNYIKKGYIPTANDDDFLVYQKCRHVKQSLLQLKSDDPEAYEYLIESKLAEVNERLDEAEKQAKTIKTKAFYDSVMNEIKKARDIIAFANW